jgi:hypothetical protein
MAQEFAAFHQAAYPDQANPVIADHARWRWNISSRPAGAAISARGSFAP